VVAGEKVLSALPNKACILSRQAWVMAKMPSPLKCLEAAAARPSSVPPYTQMTD
jgi:hypothetical protein